MGSVKWWCRAQVVAAGGDTDGSAHRPGVAASGGARTPVR
jgi:hypothetical protein